LETYRKVMLHLIMPPFDFYKVQAQIESTFDSSMHRSEEQSKGDWMEVDSIVTP
jgi:hypothetical protein